MATNLKFPLNSAQSDFELDLNELIKYICTHAEKDLKNNLISPGGKAELLQTLTSASVSYTHLRAHET